MHTYIETTPYVSLQWHIYTCIHTHTFIRTCPNTHMHTYIETKPYVSLQWHKAHVAATAAADCCRLTGHVQHVAATAAVDCCRLTGHVQHVAATAAVDCCRSKSVCVYIYIYIYIYVYLCMYTARQGKCMDMYMYACM